MFKSVIGRGHPEFSSSRQQDAQEFFLLFLSTLDRAEVGQTFVFKKKKNIFLCTLWKTLICLHSLTLAILFKGTIYIISRRRVTLCMNEPFDTFIIVEFFTMVACGRFCKHGTEKVIQVPKLSKIRNPTLVLWGKLLNIRRSRHRAFVPVPDRKGHGSESCQWSLQYLKAKILTRYYINNILKF